MAAAVAFELAHNAGNGHCFIPQEKLIAAVSQLIDVDRELAAAGIDVLTETGEVVRETIVGCDACYLYRLYDAETYTAKRLTDMTLRRTEDEADVDKLISQIEQEQGIRYAPLQRRTLELALRNRVVVLTGGPGTGKTTSVRAILAMFDSLGLTTLLAAPTGRAAKRMTELTGRDAATIHRLLGAKMSDDGENTLFTKGEDDPLDCEAVILDECSMVDITLMRALLAALPEDCRLILVGDADQLPPSARAAYFPILSAARWCPQCACRRFFARRRAAVLSATPISLIAASIRTLRKMPEIFSV